MTQPGFDPKLDLPTESDGSRVGTFLAVLVVLCLSVLILAGTLACLIVLARWAL